MKTLPAKHPVAFGLLWAAVTYSVYSNLVFYAPDTMADRYLFVPSVGLAIVAMWGIFQCGGIDWQAAVFSHRRSRVALAGLLIVLIAYSARTSIGSGDWRNDSTLIHNRIDHMQNNAAAQVIYGYMLTQESTTARSLEARREQRAGAMRAYMTALRVYPDFEGAWIAVGRMFGEEGIYEKAELAFLKAQRLEPLDANAYFGLGSVCLVQRDHELAIPYLEKAVLLDPTMEEAYVMLGRAYLQADNVDNLGAMAATARKWFPSNVELDALMATYLFRVRHYQDAVALAKTVVGKDPRNILALTILSSPNAQDVARR
jgi:protein O-mannosyl-transferase